MTPHEPSLREAAAGTCLGGTTGTAAGGSDFSAGTTGTAVGGSDFSAGTTGTAVGG